MKGTIGAAACLVLVACGGAEFGGLGQPKPSLTAQGEGGGDDASPAAADDAGARLEDAGELAAEVGPDAGDGSIRIKPERDAGEVLEDSGPAVSFDAGGGEGDASASCSNASACPSCGSAIQVACCTTADRCGCAFGVGSTCVER